MTNALKFTPTDGTVTIVLSYSLDKGDMKPFADAGLAELCGVFIIEVVDTGAGISKENMKKLFQQFSQFDRNKLQSGGGSGLGLVSRRA